MNIATVIMGTGTYRQFLIPLIQSIDKFFLKKHSVCVYSFSDNKIEGRDVIRIDHLPIPLNTLLKFKYINTIKSTLSFYDLIYYIDGDCTVVDDIDESVLPDKFGQLVAVQHPWQGVNSTSYEVNINSTACVLSSGDNHYYQACFFGGFTKDFLQMSEEIEKNIDIDLKNRIISRFCEESHLNKYFINHTPKQLDAGYAYPDPDIWHQQFSFPMKIKHGNCESIIK